MKKVSLLFAGIFLCLLTHATTKTVLANLGNGWGSATNWLPSGVPQNGDEVIIPAGLTISVKGSFYGSTPANLKIYVHGNLDFDPSGKLNLGTSSVVQLTSIISSITSNGTSSEQIIIGGGIKYNGSNDGTVTGPAFTTYSSPNSTSGNAKAGFTFGVLPVKLTSFTAQAKEGTVIVDWTTALEEELKNFELQKSSNGRDWKSIASINPKNKCDCATNYHYEDRMPDKGTNYYRLLFRNIDGSFDLSTVVMAKTASASNKAVIIEKVAGSSILTVKFNATEIQLPVQMQLLSANGQVILSKKATSTLTSLDINSLHNGISVLVLIDSKGNKYVEKIMK